jgi:hypothetical protein
MTERDLVLNASLAAFLQYDLERAGQYLPIWTVTANPDDYPDHFAARLFLTGNGPAAGRSRYVLLGTTLDELRAQLPEHLSRLARDPEDDPVIVENWL